MPVPRTPIRRRRTIAIASSLALVAPPPSDTEPAAEPPEAGVPATEPDAEPEAPAGPNDLPAVVVRDIATGDEVDLSTFAPGELPFVVWFYAPH